jgi:hypothetical protein
LAFRSRPPRLCVWLIANALRDLEGEIYRQLIGGERIHLELMRIAHKQFVWQQNRLNWRPIIRYYKLFNTPEIVAERATGLTVRDFLQKSKGSPTTQY